MYLNASCIKHFRNKLTFWVAIWGLMIPLLASWRYGAALFPDSVNYLHAARSLAESGKLLQFTGEMYVSWPPLYAFTISLFSGFGLISYQLAAVIINIISGALTLVCVFRLMSKEVQTQTDLWLTFFLTMGMWPVLDLSSEIVSEPLFIALISAGFYAVADRHWFILGLIGFSLAMLQRYIGFIWWLYVVVWGFFELPKKNHWSLISAISIFPLGFWLLRNLAETNTLTGVRNGDFIPVFETLFQGFDIVSKWLFPHVLPTWLRISFIVMGLLFLMGYLVTHYKNRVGVHASLLALLYFVSITLTSSFGASEPMSFRLLAPLYPLFLVSFWRSLHRFFSHIMPNFKLAFTLIIVVVAAYQLLFLSRLTYDKWQRGAGGFSREEWVQSDGIKFVQKHAHKQIQWISNAADGIYARSELYARMSPFQNEFAQLDSLIPKGSTLIWFRSMNRKTLIPLDSLVHRLNLTHDTTLSDAEIWIRDHN